MYSVANGVPNKELENQGFMRILLSKSQTNTIFLNDLININKSCLFDSILCVGESLNGSSTLRVVSCADCWSILNYQNLKLLNGANWYLVKNKSFGFTSKTELTSCESNNNSLCWGLIESIPSLRAINEKRVKRSSNSFIKYIYLLNDTSNIKIIQQIINASLITSTITSTKSI